MALPSILIDPLSKRKARIDATEGQTQALVVATRPIEVRESLPRFFLNPTYGADLNQDATVSGLSDNVYTNGLGTTAEWTATAIVGTWDFDSTGVTAHTLATSIDGTLTVNNDVMQLQREVHITAGTFDTFTGAIWLDTWPASGTRHVTIQGYDTVLADFVGDVVNIDDFIDTGSLSTWQTYAIPLTNMALDSATFDAFRITTVLSSGQAQDFYLDTLKLLSGGSLTYTLPLGVDETVLVERVVVTMVDAFAGTLADGTMPRIPYDGLLGVSKLSNGIVVTREKDGEVQFSVPIRQLIDFISQPATKLDGSGSDGTNTWMRVLVDIAGGPLTLRGAERDTFTFTISDDLSGLLHFRVSASVQEDVTRDQRA